MVLANLPCPTAFLVNCFRLVAMPQSLGDLCRKTQVQCEAWLECVVKMTIFTPTYLQENI